jgi:hypothetical protein
MNTNFLDKIAKTIPIIDKVLKMLFFKELLLLDNVTFKAKVDLNRRVLDSCGKCRKAETPQERMRRGGSAHAPRKASIMEWKSTYTF